MCPTLCDRMDCSLPDSSVHGIFQARIVEWVAISFSRGSSQPRDQTWVSLIAGRCFIWATREAPNWMSECPLLIVRFFFNFYTNIVDSQCCISFTCTAKWLHYCCCCSVAESSPTLYHPTNCRSGFPVLHCFLAFAQTHVRWFSDAMQPSHPLPPSPPPALNLS